MARAGAGVMGNGCDIARARRGRRRASVCGCVCDVRDLKRFGTSGVVDVEVLFANGVIATRASANESYFRRLFVAMWRRSLGLRRMSPPPISYTVFWLVMCFSLA